VRYGASALLIVGMVLGVALAMLVHVPARWQHVRAVLHLSKGLRAICLRHLCARYPVQRTHDLLAVPPTARGNWLYGCDGALATRDPGPYRSFVHWRVGVARGEHGWAFCAGGRPARSFALGLDPERPARHSGDLTGRTGAAALSAEIGQKAYPVQRVRFLPMSRPGAPRVP
jgi:hypothetical protein